MVKIAHIVNPVKVGPQSDLFAAQPVTFETMRRAREYARGRAEVSLFTAQYPEDRGIIPDFFTQTPDLERSVLDVFTFQKKRKLPLIKDILDRLYHAAPEADFLVYTNSDIALQPYFYAAVARLVETGHDGIIANRRTISKKHDQIEDLDLMYSEVGEPHGGIDCLVFRREAYQHYVLGEAFIGFDPIGKVVGANVLLFSKKFIWLWDEGLTFHLGNDKTWFSEDFKDFRMENYSQYAKVCKAHLENGAISEIQRVLMERSVLYAENFVRFIADPRAKVHDLWGVGLKKSYTLYGQGEHDKIREEFELYQEKLSPRPVSPPPPPSPGKPLLKRLLRKVGNGIVRLSD